MSAIPPQITDHPDWLSVQPTGTLLPMDVTVLSVPSGLTTTFNSPYVGNLASVLVALANQNPVDLLWAISWFSKPNDYANGIVTENFVKNGAYFTFLQLPVLGPYLGIQCSNPGAGTPGIQAYVIGAPVGAVGSIITPHVLFDIQAQVVAPASTVNFSPPLHVAGNAVIWGQASAAGGYISIQVRTLGSWDFMMQLTPGALQDQSAQFKLPANDIQLAITAPAGGAGTTFYCGVVSQP